MTQRVDLQTMDTSIGNCGCEVAKTWVHTCSTGAPPVPGVAATSVEVRRTSTSTSMSVFAIRGNEGASALAVDMKLEGIRQISVEKDSCSDTSVTVNFHVSIHHGIMHHTSHWLTCACVTVIAYLITSLYATVTTSHSDNLITLNPGFQGVQRTDRRAQGRPTHYIRSFTAL